MDRAMHPVKGETGSSEQMVTNPPVEIRTAITFALEPSEAIFFALELMIAILILLLLRLIGLV